MSQIQDEGEFLLYYVMYCMILHNIIGNWELLLHLKIICYSERLSLYQE